MNGSDLAIRVRHRAALIRSDIPVPRRARRSELELVLVSQAARSGGTLLQQLLDGHREVLMHPFELEIGRTRAAWPELSDHELLDASAAFETLYERSIDRFIMSGLSPHRPGSPNETRHAFRFSRFRYRRVFHDLWAARPPNSQREVLDIYFSAFWSAWRDAPRDAQPAFVGAFRPEIIADAPSMARLLADFPTGRVVSLVRDPISWLASARAQKLRYADLEWSARRWTRSVVAALDLRRSHPEQVLLGTFEDLVGDTERFTRVLADWLGISWAPSLLEPTTGGRPMKADSSFVVGGYGVRRETIARTSLVAEPDRSEMDRRCRALYDEAVALASERFADHSGG
jgi:hypothetical protein